LNTEQGQTGEIMKLHFPGSWHVPHHLSQQAHDDLLYGTALVLGIPVVVIGARYVIEGLFSLFS
jgi:hypothetical protein